MTGDRYKYLIVGAGPAGLAAAEGIRRNDEAGSILVIGGESHCPYSRVLLPDLLTGEKTPDEICLRPKQYYIDRNINLRFGSPVIGIDVDACVLRLADGTTCQYEKLLIATGGVARRLAVPGGDSPCVRYFHSLDDALSLNELVKANEPALVYGGGLIALELAVALKQIGAEVSVAMRGQGFFWRAVSGRGVQMITDRLVEHGVAIVTGKNIEKIVEDFGGCLVAFDDKTDLTVKSVVVGVGVTPNIDFMQGSGMVCDAGIKVSDHMETSVQGIYAAGDVAWFEDPFSGRMRTNANWQNALLQGQVAAENMSGGNRIFETLTGNVVDCFGLTVAFVGDVDDRESQSVVREFPDSSTMRMFVKNRRVVGATCVGKFSDRAAVSGLIRNRTTLSDDQFLHLSDINVPLSDLVD